MVPIVIRSRSLIFVGSSVWRSYAGRHRSTLRTDAIASLPKEAIAAENMVRSRERHTGHGEVPGKTYRTKCGTMTCIWFHSMHDCMDDHALHAFGNLNYDATSYDPAEKSNSEAAFKAE